MKNPRYKEVKGGSYATSKPASKPSAGKVSDEKTVSTKKVGKGGKKGKK